jgi:hypothetical protein
MEKKMIEIIVAGVVGLIVGGSLTFGVISSQKEPAPIIVPQDPIAKELGKLDVVLPICEPKFVEKNGDELCRELMCMTQTNSATGEVSGTTCDNITNLRNKKAIISFCGSQHSEKEDIAKCIDLFQRRGI